jgi:hypothetical protein
MAILNNWRPLSAGSEIFLAALVVKDHPYIAHGPIITSIVVSGKISSGETIITQSGTIYILEEELPQDQSCEFARPYLIERASRYFNKYGQTLTLDQFNELNLLIDKIIDEKNCRD